jgi:hypothetical protein
MSCFVAGSALLQIVEVYKEIQAQQMNIVSTRATDVITGRLNKE